MALSFPLPLSDFFDTLPIARVTFQAWACRSHLGDRRRRNHSRTAVANAYGVARSNWTARRTTFGRPLKRAWPFWKNQEQVFCCVIHE